MPEFEYRSEMPYPVETVFAWFEREGALQRLCPPWQDVRVIEQSGGIEDGARVVLSVPAGPMRKRWVAQHEGYEKNRQFIDRQLSGPFAHWAHHHRFEALDEQRCQLIDQIEYKPPLGPLGAMGKGLVESMLKDVFRFRHERLRNDLQLHQRYAEHPRLKIAITGSHGLVGSNLSAFLTTAGHEVYPLVRNRGHADEKAIYWNPSTQEIDRKRLEDIDAVIHLAGKNLASGRWTEDLKREIYHSRVDGTQLLANALASLNNPPRVFVSASAVGFYGKRGDEAVDEESSPGDGFLADVCKAWETAADPAREAGIRVTHPRIGVVVSGSGGAVKLMKLPFSLGLGGPVGNGQQYMSWIALDDLLGVLEAMLHDETLAGPVNATAPEPVRNKAFGKTLGGVLNRPAFMPLPQLAVRLLFGEMGDEMLLNGQYAQNAKLQANNHPYLFSQLEDALRFELGRFQ